MGMRAKLLLLLMMVTETGMTVNSTSTSDDRMENQTGTARKIFKMTSLR